MKDKSFYARLDLNDGHKLSTDFKLSQDIGLAILSKFSSLIDKPFCRSSHICASGSVAVQEIFGSVSKFAGSLSVWLFSRPNFKLLQKSSAEVLGPASGSPHSCAHMKSIAYLRQNIAALHFIFAGGNDHAFKVYLTKLANSTIGFLWKEGQLRHGLPFLSLAAALVPTFDNQ